MKKKWVSIDGWRGVYEPVPPEGFELLVSCSVVNDAGNQLKSVITKWLKQNRIKYRSGYLRTSNVFSANLYIIVEAGKLGEYAKRQIENWFVDYNNGTFSIFSGTENPLNLEEAQGQFVKTTKELIVVS